MAKEKSSWSHAIAAELRAEKAIQQLSYQELEERTGINTGTLQRYLTEKRVLPVDTLEAICEALGLDVMAIASRATASGQSAPRLLTRTRQAKSSTR